MNKISRRRFWRNTTLAAGAGLLQADAAAAQNLASAEIDARYANVIRKYGDRLSPEQRKKIREILSENEDMLAAVRAFPLENGDANAELLLLYPDVHAR